MRAPLRIFLRQTLCRIFGQTLGQKPSGPAAPRVFGRGSGLRCGFGFAFGKSFGVPSIYSLGNRLRTLGTSLGNSFTTLHPRLFNRLYHCILSLGRWFVRLFRSQSRLGKARAACRASVYPRWAPPGREGRHAAIPRLSRVNIQEPVCRVCFLKV